MSEQELIKILISVIGALGMLGGTLVLALHKGMIKRLDTLDTDLKPILRKVDVHEVLIDEVRTETKDHSKRLDHHEHRINELEKKR